MKRFALIFGTSLLVCASIKAQEVSRFTFDLGGGFTQPVSATSRRLDTGWNVGAGAGVHVSPYLGLKVQTDF